MRKDQGIDWDSALIRKAIYMTGMGLSVEVVAKQTKLSAGQLYYRMKKLGFDDARMNYRLGKSVAAKRAIAIAEGAMDKLANQKIAKLIESKMNLHDKPTPGTERPRVR